MGILSRTVLALTLGTAAAILLLALMPPDELVKPPGNDKLKHALAFATLVLPSAAVRPRWLIWTIPFALLLGIGIEILQPLVGREGDLRDILADVVGIAVGTGLGALARRALPRPG